MGIRCLIRCLVLSFLVLAGSTEAAEQLSPAGHLELKTGILSGPLNGPLRDAARNYVLRHRAALGLPASSTLGAPEVFSTRWGASVHFPQLLDGVEIDGARIVVTLDAQKRVVQLSSSVASYDRTATEWRLSLTDAMDRVSAAIPLAMRDASGRPYGGAKQLYFRLGDQVRAGYLVHVPTLERQKHWYAAVDAETGAVLWKRDWALRSEEADVYQRSPGGKSGGVGVTPVERVTLTHLPPGRTGGHLAGDQLVSVNCCPSEGCDATKGHKRIAGTTEMGGQSFKYDLAVCDQQLGATNDPARNPAGNYVFPPVDPPKKSEVSQDEPADSDLFSQVNAYHHANRVYDFIRSLSSAGQPLFPGEQLAPFQMRDVARGKVPAVVSNATLPNMQEAYTSLIFGGTAKNNTLQRFDNAQFLPRENFQVFFVGEALVDADALILYQGTKTDFGYDGSIIWHEFGHGVIHSTAKIKFDGVKLDARSANNEGGALHEGLADYFAAALGQKSEIGEYVGSRTEGLDSPNGIIRDLDNAEKCPEVLWGEPHQDSLHVSGALWQARKELFRGQDEGRTFDAAVYAALVALDPESDFDALAESVIHHVKLAFPALPNAEATMRDILRGRGVIECSKTLSVTESSKKRDIFIISSPTQAGLPSSALLPGPYQFHMHAPKGARSVSFSASIQGGFGQAAPAVTIFARRSTPVTFEVAGAALTSQSDGQANASAQGSSLRGTVNLDVPCGGDVYLALAGTGEAPSQLRNVSVTLEPASSCAVTPPPDVGPGTGTPGGDEQPGADSQEDGVDPKQLEDGCGCSGGGADAGPAMLVFALLAMAGWMRRARILR